jgi:hypothetical protein
MAPSYANDLLRSIAAHGHLSAPTDQFPFGKVQDWSAVNADMQNRGYAHDKRALQ